MTFPTLSLFFHEKALVVKLDAVKAYRGSRGTAPLRTA
jgi:hypothetical protein